MSDSLDARRRLLVTAGVASAGLLLAATDAGGVLAADPARREKDGSTRRLCCVNRHGLLKSDQIGT